MQVKANERFLIAKALIHEASEKINEAKWSNQVWLDTIADDLNRAAAWLQNCNFDRGPGVSLHQYNLGKRHGRVGIRALAHRNCRPYELAKVNESYLLGYRDGTAERGSARLDYSRKENNKVFYDGRRYEGHD